MEQEAQVTRAEFDALLVRVAALERAQTDPLVAALRLAYGTGPFIVRVILQSEDATLLTATAGRDATALGTYLRALVGRGLDAHKTERGARVFSCSPW